MADHEPSPQGDAAQRYHHGNLRHALIVAGRELLAEEGAGRFDLRKVARRAGVSHAAPYRHFADKQALLAAIAEDGFQRLTAQIQAALVGVPADTRAQLLAIGRSYIRFALEQPAHMREMFSGLTINRSAYPSLYAASKVAFAITVEVMREGQARGEIVADDAMNLALVTWSTIHGLAMLLIENQIPEAVGNPAVVEQLIQLCVQRVYEGLARGAGLEGTLDHQE